MFKVKYQNTDNNPHLSTIQILQGRGMICIILCDQTIGWKDMELTGKITAIPSET